MKKLFIVTLFFCLNTQANTFGSMGSIRDIDHDPNYRNSVYNIKKEVSECIIERESQQFHLNQKQNSLQDIFNLIETTNHGKLLISQVMPLINSEQLTFLELSEHVRRSRGLTHKISALYDFTLETPTIFYSSKDELGLVVHFLVHELEHSIDIQIPQEFRKQLVLHNKFKLIYKELGLDIEPNKVLSKAETLKIKRAYDNKIKNHHKNAYRAERLAFNQQGIFTTEITKETDCYQNYIDEHIKRNKLKLYREIPDSHIFNAYQIDPKNI